MKNQLRLSRRIVLYLLFVFICVGALIPTAVEAAVAYEGHAKAWGKRISVGFDHCLTIKSDGTVTAWGKNSRGQCNVPAGLKNVVAVSAGREHSLALKADGTVVAWGYNYYGQITIPAQAQGNVVAIAAGASVSMVLKADGTVYTWGSNDSGQCGSNGTTGVIAIDAGPGWGCLNTMVLKNNGSVQVWGNNSSGECNVPVLAQSNVVAISAGDNKIAALKSDGSIFVSGIVKIRCILYKVK